MPGLLWKAYIEEGDREKARSLYERLVNSSGHHKVWNHMLNSGVRVCLFLELLGKKRKDEEAEAKLLKAMGI